MSEFFRLIPALDEDTLSIDIVSHEDYSFSLGRGFSTPFPTPVIFRVDTALGGTTLPTLFLPEPVVHQHFLDHLREVGVNNIDDYPARIEHPNQPGPIDGYRALNIIGSVACADLERSTYEAFEGMYFFDHLVIDRDKVGAAACFRLAEAPEFIVLARTIAERLDLARFPDVKLIPIAS